MMAVSLLYIRYQQNQHLLLFSPTSAQAGASETLNEKKKKKKGKKESTKEAKEQRRVTFGASLVPSMYLSRTLEWKTRVGLVSMSVGPSRDSLPAMRHSPWSYLLMLSCHCVANIF